MTTSPRKRKPRPKLKKINTSSRQQWQSIIKDVDKENVPIRLLQRLTVNLIDGTQISINVLDLINEGNDPDNLEVALNRKIDELDQYIKDIDFYINLDAVAETIQPITDQILKDL
ncbi:MAG: hypothetical protein EBT86_11070 [Actinobacteria bacterium]|nr:hypothetical protein [Actinomycetota bacterium]